MLTPLLSPRHGTPEIVATENDYEKVITALLKVKGQLQLMPSVHLVIDIANEHI